MKRWLIERFLPMWAKESVLRDNRELKRQVRLLQRQLMEKQAYIQGLEAGIRAGKRIAIYNQGGKQ